MDTEQPLLSHPIKPLPPRVAELLGILRGDIVSGVLAPGEQLPTRLAFAEQHQISSKPCNWCSPA